MPGPRPRLYSLPSDDEAPNLDTLTLTSGAENALYPVANVINRNPAKPFKATGASCTLRFNWLTDRILFVIAIINHNLAGATVTLTNGAGVNQVIPIPANSADGQCVNAWFDLTTAWTTLQRTHDIWDLAITGAALGNIAIGEVVFLGAAMTEMNWAQLKLWPDRDIVQHRTFGASHLQYDKRIRINRASGSVDLEEDEAALRALELDANGPIQPFLFVPDEAINEAWYVQLKQNTYARSPGVASQSVSLIELAEMSMGPPLFA